MKRIDLVIVVLAMLLIASATRTSFGLGPQAAGA